MRKRARNEVGIAELKAHLSEYLRAARNGQEFVIKDRVTPIAKLMPLRPAHAPFEVRPPTRSMAEVERILRSVPRKPDVPPEDLERIMEENKRDVYDKWIDGELT